MQWLGQIHKGRAVPECAGLACYQRNVVRPVIARLTAVDQAIMAGDHDVAGHMVSTRFGYNRVLTLWPANSHGTE